MTKKHSLIIPIIIFILFSIIFFVLANKPSWDNMTIKDFKITSFRDSWENYPFPAEQVNPTLISNAIPELTNKIDNTELYKWKSGDNTYAFIYAIQLKNSLPPSSQNNVLLNKEYVNNEETYTQIIPVTYDGQTENMKLYLFDENKFIFVVGGFWSFPESLVEKIVDKYPTKPTESKIMIGQEFTENTLINYFR